MNPLNHKPPQLIAHLTRLIIKLFYHSTPHFRLILELLLEGPRTTAQVHQMLRGDIESSEDMKMFKEEYLRDLTINRIRSAGGDVIDGEMKAFALETLDDLTFNPYGSRLTDVEMARLLDLPLGEVQGFLGKLVQDKLICVDTKWKAPKTRIQQEDERLDSFRRYKRGGKQPNPVMYYIDYVQFINVVKLRLARLEKSVEQVEQEREVDYACENCGQHYTMYQVGVLANQKCTRCGGIVNETQADQNMTDLAEEKRKFEEKIRPLKEMLMQCQEFVIAKHHTHELKEFITKAEAVKRRLAEERTMDDETRERKKRKRMGITVEKPRPTTQFSTVTISAQPSPIAATAAVKATAAPAFSSNQGSILPHFLNSSKMQMEINKRQEEQKQEQEQQEKEREDKILEQQQEQEEDRKREEQLLKQQQELILVMEEKDEFAQESNPVLSVGGQEKRFDDITSDDVDRMTEEEYEVYEAYASARSGSGGGVEMSDDF